ncbi:hypothetical protein AUR67_00345 [Pseudoalteromonas sp. XI10]|nr:hypothetical protein AUR67_00345 [Pseudoalteromonas sp. XI10]
MLLVNAVKWSCVKRKIKAIWLVSDNAKVWFYDKNSQNVVYSFGIKMYCSCQGGKAVYKAS